MDTSQIIEALVVSEIKELCNSCVNAKDCAYRKQDERAVIQCEMFEAGPDEITVEVETLGLCNTCALASQCRLPGRMTGVWHCNEFL